MRCLRAGITLAVSALPELFRKTIASIGMPASTCLRSSSGNIESFPHRRTHGKRIQMDDERPLQSGQLHVHQIDIDIFLCWHFPNGRYSIPSHSRLWDSQKKPAFGNSWLIVSWKRVQSSNTPVYAQLALSLKLPLPRQTPAHLQVHH